MGLFRYVFLDFCGRVGIVFRVFFGFVVYVVCIVL